MLASATDGAKSKQLRRGGDVVVLVKYITMRTYQICNSFLNELQERKTAETSIPHERSVVSPRLFNFSIDAASK